MPCDTPCSVPSASRLNLENVDDDVLYLILAKIPPFGFQGASKVSHRLRYACVPFMFRMCTQVSLMVVTSFRRIRYGLIFGSWIFFGHRITLQNSVPSSTSCCRIYMPCIRSHSNDTLEMTYTQWPPESPFDIEVLSSMQLSLRKFDYEGCFSFWSDPDPEDLVLRETQWVCWILERSRSSLESIRIPSETAQYSLMAARLWPRLQQMTLYGFNPGPDVSFLSLLALLAVMPSMTSLTLKLAQNMEEPHSCSGPEAPEELDLSNLRQFTMSYPHPDDEIFAHLPSELRGISLRDSPRYYICDMYMMIPNRAPLLSGIDLLRILDIRTFAALERLEIVYRADSSDLQVIESIVDMFPQLRSLEIHRYPSHDKERSHLKKKFHPSLKVTLESLGVLGERAQIVADAFRVSQLVEVAFIRRNFHENYWATWYIDRDPYGSITNLFYETRSSHSCDFYDEIGPMMPWEGKSAHIKPYEHYHFLPSSIRA
ncbi:hypothetical protein A0H81_12508 [Grifola frondosa]|uniref:F-box domain-containing protein n=1 Tax=Grifola frondosa TaxID=5627 RepID=A0A1C7LRR9_GRIFR|nr:hypothetical protein A0H81_12508 [Grifola frondosa]